MTGSCHVTAHLEADADPELVHNLQKRSTSDHPHQPSPTSYDSMVLQNRPPSQQGNECSEHETQKSFAYQVPKLTTTRSMKSGCRQDCGPLEGSREGSFAPPSFWWPRLPSTAAAYLSSFQTALSPTRHTCRFCTCLCSSVLLLGQHHLDQGPL